MSGSRRESTNVRTVGEEPPYLTVGTEVSAKYRGAFCEANIKSVKKNVKCKVTLDKGNESITVVEDCITGSLKVGSGVEVRVPDGQDVTGTLMKVTDCSEYTVVFDDGDERTLKRTSLCLKGEKHFNESETLDHLPLTDPENFGTPVVQQGKKSRKGRRYSTSTDDIKEADEIQVRKKLLRSEENADKVVIVNISEKKKSFSLPALQVSVDSHYGRLKSPENILVRSFRDGKYIEVHPKDVKEFSKESAIDSSFAKADTVLLKLAWEQALKYLETKQLPSDWIEQVSKSKEILNELDDNSSSDDEYELYEAEKEAFMTDLNKFLEDKGTPLARCPVLGHRDLDLYKLYKIVSQMGGMNKVKSWHLVYEKMDIPIVTSTASYHIKNAYKRYLFDYDQHQREKSDKKMQAESKSGKKPEKSSAKSTASSKQGRRDEVQSPSDSDRECKELSLAEELKLSNYGKSSRAGRSKNKSETTRTRSERTRSLKSPNSPLFSPRSPCSPKSVSSVSASGSTGCPSPSENLCDSRELRTRTREGSCDNGDKNNEKTLKEVENVTDQKISIPRDNRERDSVAKLADVKVSLCDLTKKDAKDKGYRNCRKGKGGGNIADVLDKDVAKMVGEETNSGNGKGSFKKNTKNSEIKKENSKRSGGNKRDLRREDTKRNEAEREDVSKDFGKRPCVKEKDGDKMEDVKEEEPVEEDAAAESEDAVDVVNSPSATSESVDGDEQDDKRTEKPGGENDGKVETSGRAGEKDSKTNDGSSYLEYKLHDHIDVRYGRGRNTTVYHAKITSVDPCAEEGLFYLVHYLGWNARHDEWVGPERIIGRGQKQTRTRANKEPPKNDNKTPKPTAKPLPKPVVKKNGKNAAADKQLGRSLTGKGRKRTPSPTIRVPLSRNGNGRAAKNRTEKMSLESLDLANVKGQFRVTRSNSLSTPVDPPESDNIGQKTQDTKSENGKEFTLSPRRPSPNQTSPSSLADTNSDSAHESDEKSTEMEIDDEIPPSAVDEIEEPSQTKAVETGSPKNAVSEAASSQVIPECSLKRPRETDDKSDHFSPAKRKPEDMSHEMAFEETKSLETLKVTNMPASPDPEAGFDDANTPDLTCSEQLSTNCMSPDPYGDEYPRNGGYFENGLGDEKTGREAKEKESSSSLDEGKPEKTTNRKAKGRRERKTRAPSSQSSCDGGECSNGSANGTSLALMLPPSWTPRYNFTEDLDELLKKEESSERIRLLQEKITDIRKVYSELKSEVANIDRKKKRRLKKKREEGLSAEESATRSPSRSSPLTTSNATAVSTSSNLATVECR